MMGSSAAFSQQIATWANGKKLDGVVWTILPPKLGNAERVPTRAEVTNYLSTLAGRKLQRAQDYIRYAPPQIRTNYRAAIETKLGWTCDPSATQDEIC